MKKGDIFNLPKYAGVFTLTQISTGKVYVGQAIKLKKRVLHLLQTDKIPIAKAFNEDTIGDFELKIHMKISDALSGYTKHMLTIKSKELLNTEQSLEPLGFNEVEELDILFTGKEI